MESIQIRKTVRKGDIRRVEAMVRSTGFFREDEIRVAAELVEERFRKGTESEYEFLFAETGRETVAYCCFGLIPCTLYSYDLYWIATLPGYMNRGIGRKLLQDAERVIRENGGRAIYVETSSRELYAPTRAFYEKNGYRMEARFAHFYDVNDDKIVYVKRFKPG